MTKQIGAGVLAALLALAYFGFAPQVGRAFGHPHIATRYTAIDFTIFYCGGRAVRARANPYTVEPLTSCEHAYWPADYLPGFSEPVAFPGSTLAVFAALAAFPYASAKGIWLLALCTCFGLAVFFGAQLSRAPPLAILALLAVPIALLNIGVGQLAPIFCAAVFACAWYAREGRDRAAAWCALASAIEPHIGLPVIIALFVFAPRARATLAFGTLALAGVHVALLGPTLAASYFTEVLPAQAHAEYLAADQFGTIWWLTQLGFPSAVVARVSTILYLGAIALGIGIAARAVRRTDDPAFAIAIPLALALVATPYLHDVELGVALVAPLAGLATNPRDPRWLACAVVLAVPWFAAARSLALAVTCIAAVTAFVARCTVRRDVRSAEPALATALAVAVALAGAERLPITPRPATAGAALDGRALAAASWEEWIASQPLDDASGPRTFLPKLLTVAGLIAASF